MKKKSQEYWFLIGDKLISKTWSSMVFTPSAPRSCEACWVKSVRPHNTILKPRSSWNLAEAASASRYLKDWKQHSDLQEYNKKINNKNIYIFIYLLFVFVILEYLTWVVGAHSPVQGEAVWPFVWRHHCPPIGFGDVQREPQRLGSIPWAEEGAGTACRTTWILS